MRTKKLARQLKKAFGDPEVEKRWADLAQRQPLSISEDEANELLGPLVKFSGFLDMIEDSYQQNEKRLELAKRNLEVSSRELTESNQKLFSMNYTFDAMVNSLGQGFFMFGRDGQCLSVYSKVSEQLLDVKPVGKHVTKVLRIPEKEQDEFMKWTELLFSETIDFEDLADLGPKRFDYQGSREISLEFKPVRNSEKQIAYILVIATDRTKELAAKRKADQLRAYASMVVKIVKDRYQFIRFINESRAMFKQLRMLLEKGGISPWEVDTVKRTLHTLKGAAASFSVESIKQMIHSVESQLAGTGDPEHIFTFLSEALPNMEKTFEQMIETNKHILGKDWDTEAASVREVPTCKLSRFAHMIKKQEVPQEQMYAFFLREIMATPLEQVFSHYNDVVADVAKKLRKEVKPIEFSGGEIAVIRENYDNVFGTFIHIFRNIVDHGIEEPGYRKELGKAPEGRIHVSFERVDQQGQGEMLKIIIADDGIGVDPDRIRHKLSARKDLNLNELSEHDLIQYIFEPGLSTAETLTGLSGRGVGLDAVKHAVKRVGGSVVAYSTRTKGCQFEILLPWRLEWAPTEVELEQAGLTKAA